MRGALHVRHQLRDFLPRETDFDIVALQHLGTENLRNPAVDFREVDHGLPFGDPLRKIGNLEPQLGLQIMRPRQEELRRDAVKEVAEFQADLIR